MNPTTKPSIDLKSIIFLIGLILTIIMFYTNHSIISYKYIKSLENGPSFPDGCEKNYPQNYTWKGQIIWIEKDNCCTTLLNGYGKNHQNLYKEYCYKMGVLK